MAKLQKLSDLGDGLNGAKRLNGLNLLNGRRPLSAARRKYFPQRWKQAYARCKAFRRPGRQEG
jgi:hypothetical protein